MSTSNLSETFHNIWLQQFGNKGICFFVATSNGYVRTLGQSSLYHAFLQGGVFGIGPKKNEFHLRKSNQSKDLVQIVIAIAKYTLSFGLYFRIPHLECEKMFGLRRFKANLRPGSEANTH